MRNKVIGAIVIVVVLAVVGSIVWLFLSGRLVWADPSNAQRVNAKVVCDAAIVEKYNTASRYTMPEPDTEPVRDTEGLKNLKNDIKGKADNEGDPTCQTILFWIAVGEVDYDGAKAAYEKVKALHEDRLFSDSNLINNQPLSSYEDVVWSLSPEAAEDDGGIRDEN